MTGGKMWQEVIYEHELKLSIYNLLLGLGYIIYF